jgi:hypothetical protein
MRPEVTGINANELPMCRPCNLWSCSAAFSDRENVIAARCHESIFFRVNRREAGHGVYCFVLRMPGRFHRGATNGAPVRLCPACDNAREVQASIFCATLAWLPNANLLVSNSREPFAQHAVARFISISKPRTWLCCRAATRLGFRADLGKCGLRSLESVPSAQVLDFLV